MGDSEPDKIQPIEPIEPYQEEEDTVDETPPVRSKRGAKDRKGTGRMERSGRRGRPDSIARITRFEPKSFIKRFLFSGLGAAAVIGAQVALTKDYALAEMASRGTMGYVLFGAIAAGIFIFCGIFCGIVAPRSLFRGFLLGAGLTAIAGVILSVAPNLPIEPPLEPEAEASLAPLRAVMTAVNPKYLANASELEKAKADVAAAAASKDEAQKKLDGLEVKLGEETAAKTAAEKTAEERAGDIEKQKAFVAAANERVQNAESVVKKLQADIETQKTTLADAGEKIKAAQAESMDAKAKLAAALEGKKRLEEASKGPGGAEEIANLKLRLELANGKVAGLQKKVLDAEAAVKAANSGMPEWLSSEELEKLRKLEGRSQARVKKLLR